MKKILIIVSILIGVLIFVVIGIGVFVGVTTTGDKNVAFGPYTLSIPKKFDTEYNLDELRLEISDVPVTYVMTIYSLAVQDSSEDYKKNFEDTYPSLLNDIYTSKGYSVNQEPKTETISGLDITYYEVNNGDLFRLVGYIRMTELNDVFYFDISTDAYYPTTELFIIAPIIASARA